MALFTLDLKHDNKDLFFSIHWDAFIVKSVPKEQEDERGTTPSRLFPAVTVPTVALSCCVPWES